MIFIHMYYLLYLTVIHGVVAVPIFEKYLENNLPQQVLHAMILMISKITLSLYTKAPVKYFSIHNKFLKNLHEQ